jgi:cell division protein FtsZ
VIAFELPKQDSLPRVRIKVMGVGGAGGNIVASMLDAQMEDIEFIVANTDAQSLHLSAAPHKIQLGMKSTKGLGAGANPERGKRAAEEDLSIIMDYLSDADIVFLTGGMGGGTGSGALPVIARALKEREILSIAVVTKPFKFEGSQCASIAQQAIDALQKEVDTLLIIPNQKLLECVDKHVSMINAFAMINSILNQSVKGIAEIITRPGYINVDFADVRTIMKDMGLAVMGTGCASGEHRALEAVEQAIASPLLENMNISGAQGVLVNISGGPDLGLHEISDAASLVSEQAAPNATVIIGSVIDQTLEGKIKITVIATGFNRTAPIEKQVVMPTAQAAAPIVMAPVASPVKEVVMPQPPVESVSVRENEAKAANVATADTTVDLDIPTFLRNQEKQRIERL